MTGGFHVEPGRLDGHAGQLDAHAARMRQVVDAAQPLGLDAYGIVGQAFAATAARAAGTCSAAVADLSELAQDFGARLRGCSVDYRAVDELVAASFEEFR